MEQKFTYIFHLLLSWQIELIPVQYLIKIKLASQNQIKVTYENKQVFACGEGG